MVDIRFETDCEKGVQKKTEIMVPKLLGKY